MSSFSDFVTPRSSAEPEAETVRAASECLDRFTAAFNAGDASAMDRELHFPHVMFSGSEQLIWQRAGQHPAGFFVGLRDSGWNHTRYEAKQPVLVSQDKVHFVLTYTRHAADDTVLSVHRNLWVLTCIAGRWGIAVRSY